jgi:hypothetical protein
MLAGAEAVADDGVLADADEASGLADAYALGDVLQKRDGYLIGEAGVEQGGALALGESRLAGLAVEEATLLLAVAAANGEVAKAAFAEVGARRVLAAKARQVVLRHG